MKNLFMSLFILFSAVTIMAEDTLTTDSGLKYIINEKGNGAKAEPGMAVEVHYTGYLLDGKVFDSSRERGEPIDFTLGEGRVIKGWDEGIALMNVGDKLRLIIPSELAYGSREIPDVIPANSMLIFDVELMDVYPPKTSIAEEMLEIILNSGIDAAKERYHQVKGDTEKYNLKENQLNMLGYQLMQGGMITEAIEVLKLNVEAYPGSWNVYDSLGQAYLLNGDTEEAKKNYQRSLELNPDNKNAEQMLEKINAQ
jgi:hypothetical protein